MTAAPATCGKLITYLAGATEWGSESGTQPFPIGVGRNGRLVSCINVLIKASAPEEYAAPFPTITSGLFLKEVSIF